MVAAAFWDNVACHLALPVSTTHTTVGATIGAALAVHGGRAVVWWRPRHEFPYVGGIAPIVLSWLVSPLLAGAFVAALFGTLRACVLRSPNSFNRALFVLPACVALLGFTLAVVIAQTYYKNRRDLAGVALPRHEEMVTLLIGAGVGGVGALLSALLTAFVLKPRVEAAEERATAASAARKAAVAEAARVAASKGRPPPSARTLAALADIDDAAFAPPSAFWQRVSAAWTNFRATRVGSLVLDNAAARAVSRGATYRVHDAVETDERVAEVWESAEVFDFKTERLFRYLQVRVWREGGGGVDRGAPRPHTRLSTHACPSTLAPLTLTPDRHRLRHGLCPRLQRCRQRGGPVCCGVLGEGARCGRRGGGREGAWVDIRTKNCPACSPRRPPCPHTHRRGAPARRRAATPPCRWGACREREERDTRAREQESRPHTPTMPLPRNPTLHSILAIGGAGIVTGLAVYGYKVLCVLAVRSVKLTNARGFCVELASALTVVLASRFGLPVPTTQVVCGAVVSVGLMEGARGVNYRMVVRMAAGWVLTLIIAASLAAALTACGVYTTNKAASQAAAVARAEASG